MAIPGWRRIQTTSARNRRYLYKGQLLQRHIEQVPHRLSQRLSDDQRQKKTCQPAQHDTWPTRRCIHEIKAVLVFQSAREVIEVSNRRPTPSQLMFDIPVSRGRENDAHIVQININNTDERIGHGISTLPSHNRPQNCLTEINYCPNSSQHEPKRPAAITICTHEHSRSLMKYKTTL